MRAIWLSTSNKAASTDLPTIHTLAELANVMSSAQPTNQDPTVNR